MTPAQVRQTEVTFYAKDGFPLKGTRFEPIDTPTRATVVFGCATGVYAKFYNDFASWLATHGVWALTFDYRYMGLSFPPHYDPKSFTEEDRHAAMLTCPEDTWLTKTYGKVDFASAVRYASDLNPGVPLTIVSNSLGGHLMTLFPEEWPRITRFLSISGGNAYWRNIADAKPARKMIEEVIKKELEETRLFPAEMLNLGRSLPYGPGREWVMWSEHPHFALRIKEDADMVRKLSGKQLLYIGFEDDETVNKKMMMTQMGLYSHADRMKHSLWIDPARQTPQWPPCKHVNSFMRTRASPPVDGPPIPRREDTVWQVYLAYILTGHIDTSLGEYKCWGPDDERDLDTERAKHEKWVQSEKRRKESMKSRSKHWLSLPWSSKARL